MSIGPDLVVVFRLRDNEHAVNAIERIKKGVIRYRGFRIHESKKGWFSFHHQEYEYYILTHFGMTGNQDPAINETVIILSADSDEMLNDDGEMDSDFWKAFQNAIALIVAEINPYFGIITDSDTMVKLLMTGIENALNNGGYYSADYINDHLAGKKQIIKKYMTRELRYGSLVIPLLLSNHELELFKKCLNAKSNSSNP